MQLKIIFFENFWWTHALLPKLSEPKSYLHYISEPIDGVLLLQTIVWTSAINNNGLSLYPDSFRSEEIRDKILLEYFGYRPLNSAFYLKIAVSPGLTGKVCEDNALPAIKTCPPIERCLVELQQNKRIATTFYYAWKSANSASVCYC